jgi:hypothetical protein
VKPFQTRPVADPLDWARRHPFIVVSVVLHLLLLTLLYAAGPYTLRQQQAQQAQARVSAALEQARRQQMQRHLNRLEKLEREMAAKAGGAPDEPLPPAAAGDPQAVLARARELTRRVELAEQNRRAAELSRLLKIPPAEALARLKAEDAKRPAPPLPADPAQALAQLERRAQQAAARERERERRQQEGVAIAKTGGGDQGRFSSGVSEGGARQGDGKGGGKGDRSGTTEAGSAGQGGASGTGGGPEGGEATASVGGVGEPGRRYDSPAVAPSLDRATLRLASGRILGPGGVLANRIFLDRWYVVGPFAAPSSRSMNTVYPPELAVDLDAVYEGKGGELVAWRYVSSPSYPVVPPQRSPDAVFYTYTELRVDRDMTIWVDLGVDDDAKMWINDELVWVSGNADKRWYRRPFYLLDEDLTRYGLVESRQRITLRAGSNTLLLKLYNGIDLMFISVVLAP